MIFLDNYSYLEHRVLNKQLNELEDNKKYYQEEIRKDSNNIKQLKNPDQIEKYARESSAYYSTARLWDDGVIDPVNTRQVLGLALSVVLNSPVDEQGFGVFRM